jgi:type I restriction enzyme S subunit
VTAAPPTVGDVLLAIESGKSVKTKERPAQSGELAILKVSAVTWGEFRPHENKAVFDDYDPGDCPRPKDGDLLISRANTRELVGAPVLVAGDHPNLLLSDKILRLVPNLARVDRRYLAHALRSTRSRRHFESRAGGTSGSMTNITQEDIRSAPLPLPPLSEQRRQADMLDKADAIRRKREEAIALAEQLPSSAFMDMFGDPIVNPRNWLLRPIGDVADVSGGLQVTSARSKNAISLPYLRVANVFRDRLELAEIKHILVTESERARALLRAGDVLVVEGHGNPGELGRAALWNAEIAECTHQNHLIRVRPRIDALRPRFLSAFINSSAGRKQMLRLGNTTSGLNTISTNTVRSVSVLIPPLDLQDRFVRLVEGTQRLASRMKAQGLEAQLFGALNSAAFSR